MRDVPNQRRSYDDLRALAVQLQEEGQRLGPRLKSALDRFMRSLPERFEDAEAYLVWRDGNALRRLHRAHRLVADGSEPDQARLDATVAVWLGGLLDLFNVFAFADDGIRAKDERRIAPQERAGAEAEATAAKPIVEAILATPAIATQDARDDIAYDHADADLPVDDPYAGQVLDQANRTRRNEIAGILSGGGSILVEVKKSGKEVRSGAERAIGALLISELFGVTSVSAPLIEFIALNAPFFQSYVATAFSSFPSLPDLIERITALWKLVSKR